MITFTITDEDEKKFDAFREDHISPKTNAKCELRQVNLVGDLYRWSFVPTVIGDFATVSCACGARCEVVDDRSDF